MNEWDVGEFHLSISHRLAIVDLIDYKTQLSLVSLLFLQINLSTVLIHVNLVSIVAGSDFKQRCTQKQCEIARRAPHVPPRLRSPPDQQLASSSDSALGREDRSCSGVFARFAACCVHSSTLATEQGRARCLACLFCFYFQYRHTLHVNFKK